MKNYCPNVLELAGATIGAKLIELAKSLKRMALLPASTVQLLGAEKALFRHLKLKTKSPKYGVIFQHPLIQNAKRSERGKMARRLADKLSLCARLDYFKGEFKAKEYRKMLEQGGEKNEK
jgi:nucleolar protein 56